MSAAGSTPAGTGLTIAVLGLGFGADFVPLYLSHPAVARVVLVEPDADRRAAWLRGLR